MEKPKQKISTMKDLSEAIGISRPTLSRYFQDPTAVRTSTSQKIKERLSEVDYVYNFIATRQNRKSSGLIGVIVPQYNDLFFASLLEAIKKSVRGTGYTMITQSSDGNAQGEVEAIARLRSLGADGAIIAPLGLRSSTEALIQAITDFPLVFADSLPAEDIPEADFVGTNNEQSIASIVQYLCSTGDAPIFLGMPQLNSNAVERMNAYKAKMIELGNKPQFVKADIVGESWQFEAYGHSVMDVHFRRQNHLSDTIICANDRIAIGVIRAANKYGLFDHNRDHTHGLRIAGHDNHPLSQYMFPAITTAGQDIEGIGRDALRLLLGRIRNEHEAQSVELRKEATLIIREST